ncbi:hypothetical protein K7X08_009076 [Anisodus acutangulus]|uniref:Secreted protein n=1 Tax=Anisodus acutangulus TaxID=402998 RepID=A0A9Q1MZ44_9SOLA|nr:hypothetical protein K7X08_009076 [Anisodus acutangulus]
MAFNLFFYFLLLTRSSKIDWSQNTLHKLGLCGDTMTGSRKKVCYPQPDAKGFHWLIDNQDPRDRHLIDA